MLLLDLVIRPLSAFKSGMVGSNLEIGLAVKYNRQIRYRSIQELNYARFFVSFCIQCVSRSGFLKTLIDFAHIRFQLLKYEI